MDDRLAEQLAVLYERVGQVVDAARPRCGMSGRCCDFPTSGQRLYATDLETAYAVHAAGDAIPAVASGQCPWYVDGLCRNRRGRPLGCRVYFCDPEWADAMPGTYERFHDELRALHEAHGLTYAYRPFVAALAAPAVPEDAAC